MGRKTRKGVYRPKEVIRVLSSNIEFVAEGERSTLLVKFKSGAMYVYFEVEERKVEALLSADSVGRFHSKHIKGVYPFVRVY